MDYHLPDGDIKYIENKVTTYIKENGIVVTSFELLGDYNKSRYIFDYKICSEKKGWTSLKLSKNSFDFGVWIHDDYKIVLSYSQGCVEILEHIDDYSYKSTITNILKMYNGCQSKSLNIELPSKQIYHIDIKSSERSYNVSTEY